METLMSSQNPKIKQLARLKERKERKETGLFLIEGYRECLRAFEGGVEFAQLFICPELFLGTNEASLIQSIQTQKFQISQELFEKVSYRDRPDGLMGVAYQMGRDIADLKEIIASKPNPFLVIVESIEKPGNLGSILRSCDGAGVDALIVADPCTDIYNPNVVRSSVGTLFTVPTFELTSEEIFPLLAENKISLIATSPDVKQLYNSHDMTKPLAIAFGTEQLGLSPLWLEKCDAKVAIPMLGRADSLNVSNAATLVLYEVVRQRSSLS